MHPCAECGIATHGTCMPGGVRSDLCPDCLEEALEQEQVDMELRDDPPYHLIP